MKSATNKAAFTGVIQEVVPVPSESLGLPPGKSLLRLNIFLEETRPLEGSPNILKEKEGENLTLFSDSSLSFYRPGLRISAVAEYRGGPTARLYWIMTPRPVSPSLP